MSTLMTVLFLPKKTNKFLRVIYWIFITPFIIAMIIGSCGIFAIPFVVYDKLTAKPISKNMNSVQTKQSYQPSKTPKEPPFIERYEKTEGGRRKVPLDNSKSIFVKDNQFAYLGDSCDQIYMSSFDFPKEIEETKLVFVDELTVAGTTIKSRTEEVEMVEICNDIELAIDYDNEHDDKAIGVFHDGNLIGYVPRRDKRKEELYELLADGANVYAVVSRKSTTEEDKIYIDIIFAVYK